MNIFTAARRATVVVSILIVAAFANLCTKIYPTVTLTYISPGVLVDSCDAGTSVSITVKVDRDFALYANECKPISLAAGNNVYSPNWLYSYDVPKEHIKKAFDEFQRKRTAEFSDLVVNLMACLAILWGAVFAIGWIVRGLLGIPMGKDSKPL